MPPSPKEKKPYSGLAGQGFTFKLEGSLFKAH